VKAAVGRRYDAQAALEAGLVTVAPDDLDWDDEFASRWRNAPRSRPTR